jgi:dihydroxyacetone kinase-like protein
MAMLNSMGGASGVIFGSMFLGGIKNMETITELDGNSFTVMMRSALDSIKERGKAQVGDKTMVDALEPAVIAMEKLKSNDLSKTLEAAADAATQGMEDSKKHVAKYGRAQYLGDRAIGYQDAGATSVSIIFNAMNDYCKNA